MRKNILTSGKIITSVKKNEKRQIVIFLNDSNSIDLTVDLGEENASVEIFGVVIGNNSNTISLQTNQHHISKNTKSNLYIKSLIFDNSIFNFLGLIRIEKDAHLSDAYQKNSGLLLSSKGKINTQPSLEILANDVRCTHGATIGTINDDEINYLQTRGLSKDQAKQLIISGFFQDILTNISDNKVKKELEKLIDKSLLETD